MRRQLRGFTFGAEVLARMEELLTLESSDRRHQKLMNFIYGDLSADLCDAHFMRPSDYAAVYKMMTPPPKNPIFVWDFREPTWDSLADALSHQQHVDRLLREVQQRQRNNKQTRPQAKLNASRIAEALLILGLEALEERAANLDDQGSKRKDAGEGQNKLPNRRTRKTT